MTTSKPRIVIVGGGAGGLELATRLGRTLGRKGAAEITLLDATPTHVWKPLLHEVAAGTLDETETIDYLALAFRNHFRFRLGRMQGLDREGKRIQVAAVTSDQGEQLIPERWLNYDLLVLAVGSVSNDFGIAGVKQHCRFLDSSPEAFKFQKKLVETYIQRHAHQIEKPLNIAIVGAGATGVELSAELHQVVRLLAIYGLDKAGGVKITLIEAAPRLLPALPEKLALATAHQLDRLGIVLKLNCRVTKITENSIVTQDGETLSADLKVWAAGIKGPDWLAGLGLESNRSGQLVVDQFLTTDDADIYALGDCAACAWPERESLVPPRAQAAHQQASALAKTLRNRLAGKAPVKFTYHDYGSLVSLGRYSTVGNLMGNLMGSVSVGGFIARVVYLSLYKMHQLAIHGLTRMALLTIADGLRKSTHTGIKLH